MRPFKALPAVLLLTLAAPAVIAGELDAFVAAKDGASVCWRRTYDTAHLAAHPQQLVTEVALALTYAKPTSDYGEHYTFGFEASIRGGKTGSTTGFCWAEGEQMQCAVECDGGGLLVSKRADGKVLVDLEHVGFIALQSECGSEGGGEPFDLTSGQDDKAFLMSAVDPRSCKGLIPRW